MRLDARYAATTVALVLLGLAYVLGQAWLDRPAPPRPSLAAAGRPAPPVPPLAARDFLDRADALGLTAEQRARLAALDKTWSEEARGLDRAVASARAQFERFTREAGARGASVAEIQRQSAEYRELSAALRAARERHAEAAQAVLTEAQRQGVARGRFTSVPGGER
jgi:hypothetical protein